MSSLDAVGSISNAATGATHLNNPSMPQLGSQDVTISEMAKGMLATITDLQKGFQQEVAPTAQNSSAIDEFTRTPVADSTEATHVVDATKILADQIQQSTKVQEQLTRFMMASSVSSSLGKNLNTFLRGQ